MSLASPALAGGFFTTSANWEVHRNDGGGGLVAKLCPILYNLMDCSPPGSSVHGILQERILEWVTHALLQGIFLTQELNPSLLHLLHWQAGSLPLVPPGKS